jgi:4'-phosphopantetheinyl transferase
MRTAATLLPPDADTVHVWVARIADAPVADLGALLSRDERERAARFVFERDRDQYIVVRGWLRRLLGEYLGGPPRDLAFVAGVHGKPRLADHADLHFNVSHSGNVGLLAFSRGREVGVDVERADRRVEIDELARTAFATTERQSLECLDAKARLDRFFEIWTAKEAYIKAVGGGLSIPLKDFAVDVGVAPDRWAVTTADPDTATAFSVRRIPVPPGYAGAVAAIGTRWQVRTRDLAESRAAEFA